MIVPRLIEDARFIARMDFAPDDAPIEREYPTLSEAEAAIQEAQQLLGQALAAGEKMITGSAFGAFLPVSVASFSILVRLHHEPAVSLETIWGDDD